jgi:hypothetical protein
MSLPKLFKNKSKKKTSTEDIIDQMVEDNNIDDEVYVEEDNDILNKLLNESTTNKKIFVPKKIKLNKPKNSDKPKLNSKVFIVIGVVIALLLTISLGILFFSKNKKVEPIEPVKTEEELGLESMYLSINRGVKIGETKASIIEKFAIPQEDVGKNYAIAPSYNRIGNHDFLTTFIFSEDYLVAVLHEQILDGTQRHKLAIEFQKFSERIGRYYTLIEIKQDWFVPELDYDANAWNEAIVNNELELHSNFENVETKEYVRIIASGINYFDFLAKDRESASVGNLNLLYTSSEYKDKFMSIVSLATE